MHRFFVLVMAVAVGCVSAHGILPLQVEQSIPNDAKAVELHSTSPPDKYFRTVYQKLLEEGYSIEHDNQDMGTLTTGFKDIEQETILQISAFVKGEEGGSVATLRGKWGASASMRAGFSASMGMDASGTGDVKWGGMGRPGLGFASMVKTAMAIPHDSLRYRTE